MLEKMSSPNRTLTTVIIKSDLAKSLFGGTLRVPLSFLTI